MLMRLAQPGQFSVERLFVEVASAMPDDIECELVHLPYRSQGIRDRARNLLFTVRLRADVIHITGDVNYCALAVRRRRCILTILDFVSTYRLAGWRRMLLNLLWYRLPAAWACRITAISPAVLHELTAMLPRSAAKSVVIGCPVRSELEPHHSDRSQSPGGRVLQVGTRANKNLETVALALRGMDLHLRVIGALSVEQSRLLSSLGVRYSAASNLSDLEIAEEYRLADVLVFVSTYEGFGLPIIEAQACGTAVITSAIEPMVWVAGGAAMLVSPHDPFEIREAIADVLGSPARRRGLVLAGYRNVRRFQPQVIAAQYAAQYRELAFASRSPFTKRDRSSDIEH